MFAHYSTIIKRLNRPLAYGPFFFFFTSAAKPLMILENVQAVGQLGLGSNPDDYIANGPQKSRFDIRLFSSLHLLYYMSSFHPLLTTK